MSSTVKEINYKSYGRCVEISNEKCDLLVTLDVGPRIIRFGFKGRENLFCENTDFKVKSGEEYWYIYGGHRLWHAPEANPRTYYPDNYPVHYEKIEGGIKVSVYEKWRQVIKEMDINLDEKESRVKVIHRIINKNAWDIELSVWALTVMDKGGVEIIPVNTKDTELLPNMNIAIWPYTRLNDKRVTWGEKYITIRQDENARVPFKIGLNNQAGWAAYINHGVTFIKRYKHIEGEAYPDFGVSYETYTNNFMLEMETLSPLKRIKPDEYIEHVEEWEIFDGELYSIIDK
ncbi:MAG: hypothetical protein N2486_09450 [Caloramator sp.]|nr:hypothetical protein [Caloramator sp.]